MCSVECNALCVHGDLLRKHAQNVNGNETKRPTADFADADARRSVNVPSRRAATALRLVVVPYFFEFETRSVSLSYTHSAIHRSSVRLS